MCKQTQSRSRRCSAGTAQGRYFTFIASGCLIRTRGNRRYCQQRRCLHVSSHLARQRENPVLAPPPRGPGRCVAAPPARGRQLKQNSIHTYCTLLEDINIYACLQRTARTSRPHTRQPHSSACPHTEGQDARQCLTSPFVFCFFFRDGLLSFLLIPQMNKSQPSAEMQDATVHFNHENNEP